MNSKELSNRQYLIIIISLSIIFGLLIAYFFPDLLLTYQYENVTVQKIPFEEQMNYSNLFK